MAEKNKTTKKSAANTEEVASGAEEIPVAAGAVPCHLEAMGAGWTFTASALSPLAVEGAKGRRSAGGEGLPDFLAGEDFDVLVEGELEGGAGRRSGESTSSQVQLAAEVPPDADVILTLRHPSGAITFHRPSYAPGRRSAAGAESASTRVVFDVSLHASVSETGRRGPISKLIKLVLVKVADGAKKLMKEQLQEWVGDGLYEFVVPKLAVKMEELLWKKTGRKRGWLRVTASGLAAKSDGLREEKPALAQGKRGLLLIHGTFSTAHGGFRNLVKTGFFQQIAPVYGQNVFAFNHFTISKTPAENLKEMLDALPEGDFEFDIITHSRGGLVARELLEGSGREHAKFSRLKIGNVVMVACPSAGTPLADFDTWEKRLSYLANVFDMLPDSPFTTGPAWIAEMLKWLTGNIIGNFPGLTAMTPGGEYLRGLQGGIAAPEGTGYHAVVANFHPTGKWTGRLADVGVDQFFAGANDLVVPTEGGWKTADDSADWILGSRIACFGKGGNVGTELALTHGDFFGNEKVVEFILAALQGRAANLPVMNVLADLPSRHFRATWALTREDGRETAERVEVRNDAAKLAPAAMGAVAPRESWVEPTGWADDDTLYLTLISSGQEDEFVKDQQSTILLLAQYGSARVAQPFYTRNVKKSLEDTTSDSIWTEKQMTNAGTKFSQIIAMQKQMVDYTNGKAGVRYPDTEFIRKLGKMLFEILFSGQVRRLYDAAVSSHRNKELNIVFTSMISWLSDFPWEMCYDSGYKGFLSTSNVRFLRNVLTPTPADRIIRKRDKLRILVASAQAVGSSCISNEYETRRIKDSFGSLLDAGLVEVDVLANCSPRMLHEQLRCALDEYEYDVLHYIGHGKYYEGEGGKVEFEREDGAPHSLTAEQLTSIVRSRGIRVVFLNACETGRGFGAGDKDETKEKQEPIKGVAVKMAEEGIPAVVANQYSVVDQLASLFSLNFYSCLAHGLSVSDAMREARIAVSCAEEADDMDWGVPVLFARSPHSTLCRSRPCDTNFSATVSKNHAREITRRGGKEKAVMPRGKRIAVWCTSPALSYREGLEEIVRELQEAQQEFEFVIRRRRIPAHFFNRDGARGYLSAEGILAHLTVMLKTSFNADVLVCITDQPLMSAQAEALYYFSRENIIIFSIWGFIDPPLSGSVFAAGLANHIAIGLLENLAGVHTGCEHDNDPNHPIHTIGFFNDARSVEHLAGRMEITDCTKAEIENAIRLAMLSREQYEAILKILYLHHSG